MIYYLIIKIFYMKYTILTAILLSLIFSQCSTTKNSGTQKVISDIQPRFLTNYTVNPAPNGLDSVGIVFSVDQKGAITTIGNLNLKINSDSISVPQEVSASNISFKFLLDFLAIKNLDSATNLQIRDSIKVNTNFRIDNGVYTRFDPDINLLDAFNNKKSTIISNIRFLGLQRNRLYLIVEAIKSNVVNLSNIGNSSFAFDAEGKFRQLLKLNPGLAITKIRNNSLVYSTTSQRVIFYKLRPIEIDKVKGPEAGQIDVSLGDEMVKQSLY
jgi:hypothetical protein